MSLMVDFEGKTCDRLYEINKKTHLVKCIPIAFKCMPFQLLHLTVHVFPTEKERFIFLRDKTFVSRLEIQSGSFLQTTGIMYFTFPFNSTTRRQSRLHECRKALSFRKSAHLYKSFFLLNTTSKYSH